MAEVNVTAAMVKELREKTGAGMMDCKKALIEKNGDMDAAVDYLRDRKRAWQQLLKRPVALPLKASLNLTSTWVEESAFWWKLTAKPTLSPRQMSSVS